MPNKKINQLDARTAVGTDLMLVGDPVNGTAYKSTLANLPLVPNSRTLTINGVAFDLSANRDWTITPGVSSVALSMPSAFSVANSPITSSGTLAVTALGSASQYIRGDGALATFPGTASGGSAVSYYLNGGTAASVATYYQMSKTAVLGAAADFNLVGNGLIAQFLTDVSDPNRLEIPAGNWNFELYFNISSSGGNTAFYVELLKYNGSTFTSIASSVGTPEAITGGTLIDLYLTSLAIPQTTLLASDRLALRVYIVSNSGGRTVTLHTQNGHLCEIITNFAGGVSALNGITANTQYFATGTSGTDFGISSVSDTHTFNLPTASATNRGALSSADWSTFNGKVPSSRTLTINGTAFDLSADRSWTIPSSNIYNADGTLTAARTLTHGGFNLSLVGSIHTNRFTAAGRLLLGTTTEGTFLLDVNADARINGVIIGRGGGSVASNTAIGSSSLSLNSTGANNVAIGFSALSKTTASNNVAIGHTALTNQTSGSSNVGIGSASMSALTTGVNNIGIGVLALSSITTQNGNVAIGDQAMISATTSNSVAIGINSLRNTTTTGNIAIGQNSLTATSSGANNTSIGTLAMQSNTTGGNNTSVGTAAFFSNLTGSNNVAIGAEASRFISGGVTISTIQNQSVFIGDSTRPLADNQTNQIVIGYQATGLGSNTTIIGNSSTITTALRGRLLLGTTVDSGLYQLDVNGTARVSGKLSVGTPSATSSIMEVTSTTLGFLPPRMTTTQKNAIASPVAGLQVYDSTLNQMSYYNGTTWINF